MTSKYLASAALLFSIGLAGAPSAAVYKLGSVADFAPYNYLNDEGVIEGFEVDLAKLICASAAISCDWALAPWDELIPNLLSYDIDIIMTGMQITDQRDVIIDFTQEYFPADRSAFMVMNGNTTPATSEVVGAQSDTLQAIYVPENGWTLTTFDTVEDAIYAMAAGEIQAVVADQAYLQGYMVQNPNLYSLSDTDIIIGGGIGLGVRGADTALISALNSALTALKSSGQLDALIGVWFDGRDPNYRNE